MHLHSMDDMDPGKITAVILFMLLSVPQSDESILSYKDADRTGQIKKLNIDHARHLLSRQRRDASTADEMLSNEVVLNGTENHSQAYVHWSGKSHSEAVFILTLQYDATGVSDSQTWRSVDYGTTYKRLDISSEAVISFFFVSPANYSKMVFTDIQHSRLYTTQDEMHTFDNKTLPAPADNIIMHPSNSDWMLLYHYDQRQLYVTMDFGTNWTLLHSDVNSRVFWGVPGLDDPRHVHIEVQPQDAERAMYVRCTVPECAGEGDGVDHSLGLFMSQSLLLLQDYLFVQKSSVDGTDSPLLVSYKRQSFHHAYFPGNIHTKDFLIVDGSEGQVFVAVNHGDRQGVSLYLSDVTGRYYVLSLASVHHLSAPRWFDVDMHRVQGLNGTYLANQQIKGGNGQETELKTLISLDKGGTWTTLPSPNKTCGSQNCDLLLRLDMASFLQNWILSEEKAPGFVIAHGHYGRHYDHDLHDLSVFTSVDGGWTWTESALRGVYHLNILDQGSIVTAIHTGDLHPTNTVMYSYNEGKSWQAGRLGHRNLTVDGVLNEPGINTLVASVYGHMRDRASPWTMVKLNFSRVLPRRCNHDDYNTWSMSDHDATVTENCLLGQRVTYRRRLQDARCYNGEDFERDVVNQTCPCGREDFECDFGFSLHSDKCVKDAWFDDSYLAPSCTEGLPFNRSRGYRKVGADQCEGGVDSKGDYEADSEAVCPVVAPSHLMLLSNVSVVATGRPVMFHLSQRRGSVMKTTYTWNFTDSQPLTVTGLTNAHTQTHSFSQAGRYHVSGSASNSRGQQTASVSINVEDAVHTVGVLKAWAVKVGFPLTVTVTTNLVHPDPHSSLHFLYRFGDEKSEDRNTLTWESHMTHVYNVSGNYTLSVSAVNSVSAISRQVPVTVIDEGEMVLLTFSPSVQRVIDEVHASPHRVFMILQYFRQEIVRMLAVNMDRVAVSLNATHPVRINVLVLPPPAPHTAEPSPLQIVQMFKDMVGNGTFSLFRTSGLPRNLGDITVTAVTLLSGDSEPPLTPTHTSYRAVYIALPIVILAALVTGLVLLYYRRRFRNIRRYSMVTQDEETDALLDDDDDEPPLDLRPDNSPRFHDDNMLDLGTGSHLVMVTGTSGDGAETC